MHPELFEIPFLHQTVKSWGVMVVLGFLAALWLMRRLVKTLGEDPDILGNAAVYALIAGVIGARVFFVVHHRDLFVGRWMEVFAVWQGGVELLGGVLTALLVLWLYLKKQRRSIRLYFDVLAIGLMVGLGFGRIGCFLSGCCYGKCTDLPWGVRFPYGSLVYQSQIHPDPKRHRDKPYLDLPADFFGIPGPDGGWLPVDEANKHSAYLKPFEQLTPEQQKQVSEGPYRCLKVHPTQLYSSANGFLLAAVLLGLWKKFGRTRPGVTAGAMLILYGVTRFFLETLRDDNPFEYSGFWLLYRGGTISQNMAIYLILFGICVIAYSLWKPSPLPAVSPASSPKKKASKSKSN
ncbi:MAG TPA: prolipoprotein diacylglyceryl transferase [Anaerohalosphaeraceae bacterium]|nr:prolipoprotein diacylglyceryl transferase [Anaerohalosphaeraceae bacterium]HOL89237.1 prolipoprotein diacylglyceryl transferase [Anaerohalosphaeraceae bacterium]HPP55534.1 prolipoprotein diacylglyceryl transferase [Anaerohalosphaeraceae bacterium]